MYDKLYIEMDSLMSTIRQSIDFDFYNSKTDNELVSLYNETKNKDIILFIMYRHRSMIAGFITNTAKNSRCGSGDILQEFYISIQKSVERFDINNEAALSTFIYNGLTMYQHKIVRDNGSYFHISTAYIGKKYKLDKFINNYIDTHNGQRPTIELLMEEFKVSRNTILGLLSEISIKHLNDVVSTDGYEIGDLELQCHDDGLNMILSNMIYDDLINYIKGCIKERDFDIFARYHRLDKYKHDKAQNLTDISKVYNVSRERIRQIVYRTRDKLSADTNILKYIEYLQEK